MTLAPLDTWPDLRITLHLLPWSWRFRPRIYADDVEGPLGYSSFEWLFLKVEWWSNRPLFTEPRPVVHAEPLPAHSDDGRTS